MWQIIRYDPNPIIDENFVFISGKLYYAQLHTNTNTTPCLARSKTQLGIRETVIGQLSLILISPWLIEISLQFLTKY